MPFRPGLATRDDFVACSGTCKSLIQHDCTKDCALPGEHRGDCRCSAALNTELRMLYLAQAGGRMDAVPREIS